MTKTRTPESQEPTLEELKLSHKRLMYLKQASRYESPSWGYHSGYHRVTLSHPFDFRVTQTPDTPRDFLEALDLGMNWDPNKPIVKS